MGVEYIMRWGWSTCMRWGMEYMYEVGWSTCMRLGWSYYIKLLSLDI